MPKRARKLGFTLFELVLVLVIISVVLGLAAPSMQGWARGVKLRNAADDVLRATRAARSNAVTNAAIYRLYFEPKDGRYWLMVQDGDSFQNVDTSAGREQQLVEGLTLTLTKTTPAPAEGENGRRANTGSEAETYIEFSPTGRTEPAVVKIESIQGDSLSIQCPSPAEPFRLLTGGEKQ